MLLARTRLDRAADTIVSLLRCILQVQELDITFPISHDVRPPSEGADSLDHVCRMLSRDDPALCPRLHTLTVIIERGSDTADVQGYQQHASHLTAMLDARTRMGERVRRLYFQTIWHTVVSESEHEVMYPIFLPCGLRGRVSGVHARSWPQFSRSTGVVGFVGH